VLVVVLVVVFDALVGSLAWGSLDVFGGRVRLVLGRPGLVADGCSGCVLSFQSFHVGTLVLGVGLFDALVHCWGRLVWGGLDGFRGLVWLVLKRLGLVAGGCFGHVLSFRSFHHCGNFGSECCLV